MVITGRSKGTLPRLGASLLLRPYNKLCVLCVSVVIIGRSKGTYPRLGASPLLRPYNKLCALCVSVVKNHLFNTHL